MMTYRCYCCLGFSLNSRVSPGKACVYASHWDVQERGDSVQESSLVRKMGSGQLDYEEDVEGIKPDVRI